VIYHAALPADWAAAQRVGVYTMSTRGRTLADEGFIHASYEWQVEGVANAFYADLDDLVLLTIDPDTVGVPVVDEAVASDRFPHVYGPLPVAAVIEQVRWNRQSGQPWRWPAEKSRLNR
jgi:glutathione S-transferase